MQPTPQAPFRLIDSLTKYCPAWMAGPCAAALEVITGLRRCEQVHAKAASARSPAEFSQRVLDAVQVHFDIHGSEESIPRTGPVIIVANHPLGALEGLFLYSVLARRRADARLLANRLLGRLPALSPALFSIDVFGGAEAVARNVQPLRRSLRWVQNGGSLLVFPSGEVSHWNSRSRAVVDPPWSDAIARLIRLSGASVVPIFVSGSNGLLFHLAGLLHPRLRTALLPREFVNKQGAAFQVAIGAAISPASLHKNQNDRSLADFLRLHVYALACKTAAPLTSMKTPHRIQKSEEDDTKVSPESAAAASPEALELEIGGLAPAQNLARSGSLEVWCAAASQVPWIMQEIGRLREVTFRAVGEGTGGDRDLDLYDQCYDQLILWNRTAREVVGGYRLGRMDEIRRRFGMKGIYCHSLFAIRPATLDQLGPAIEVGRSFVREEYQRSFAPVHLLWKAIARYVSANPRYHVLMGAVSISRDYAAASSALMTGYLHAQNRDPLSRARVRGRHPLTDDTASRLVKREAARLTDLDALDRIVASLEPDAKGVPVLLRQYLRLGAQVLGFNIDPAFGHSIDVLIAVDLCKTDASILSRYMGVDRMTAFRAAHGGIASELAK